MLEEAISEAEGTIDVGGHYPIPAGDNSKLA